MHDAPAIADRGVAPSIGLANQRGGTSPGIVADGVAEMAGAI